MTDYHWTPALRRAFLETLSETGSVKEACKSVSMSRRAAYNLRHKRSGFAFRIGWDAAILLARDVVADALMERVLEGQWVETIRDKEGGSTKRFSYDRNLSLALLNRLDKRVEEADGGTSFCMAAQIASQDFEAFLGLVEKESDPEDVRDFLAPMIAAWTHGHAAALTHHFDWPTPLPDPANDIAEETAEETAEPCELPQNSADVETKEETKPLRRNPNATPRIGEPGYHEWITSRPWARMGY